jgi:hypothetical protein
MPPGESREGIICLANDTVIDSFRALCESLRVHCPNRRLTVIPFDASVERTRAVVEAFDYDFYEDPSLDAMDVLGDQYWPGEAVRAHTMRKFCAFWGPYDTFLFLDADIVVVGPLDTYFEAFQASQADFMYFTSDLAMVYTGEVRNAMVVNRGAVGFNTGQFMGRKRALTPPMLDKALEESRSCRHGFVDIAEQTFFNYVVDTVELTKVDAHQAVPEVIDAWAGMRLKRQDGHLVLADARRPESGRPVSMVHWAGYRIGPFMPYRRLFLAYRLPHAGVREGLAYRTASMVSAARRVSYRTPLRVIRGCIAFTLNWLTSRFCPAVWAVVASRRRQ